MQPKTDGTHANSFLPSGFDRVDEETFRDIDYELMGVAFSVQNDLGRLVNEQVYKSQLVAQLKNVFLRTDVEVPLRIQFGSYTQTLFADIVVDNCFIIELKATKMFNESHRSQLLQYLFLSNLGYGKLINFHSAKVEGEYVSTSLDLSSRKELKFNTGGFCQATPESRWFIDFATDLLCAWGGFLKNETYYGPIVHALGGIESAVRPIPISLYGKLIGTQRTHLLSDTTGFKITSIRNHLSEYRNQLEKFLLNTKLERIEWLNLNHHEIQFETIQR